MPCLALMAIRPSHSSEFWLKSVAAAPSEAAVWVPVAAAVISTELMVVIAPRVSAPAAPQNHAQATTPAVAGVVAVIELVAPAPVVTVAFGERGPVPPP